VEENKRLSQVTDYLEKEVVHLKSRIAELEDDLNRLKVAKLISGEDTFRARQQVNELLREIDKCYSLLNR
jgi:outer membrane murein-binding lipoprotein Lpp